MKVRHTVEWCTQGFFIEKPGPPGAPLKLRLITDYRELNKMLKRPEWPFLSADAVRRQIDNNTQIFYALDLCQGYQQVPIAEEHKDLTMFSLPWGHFHYEVLPMGLCPSGDKLKMESDDATRGKEGCLKGVDDVLMQAQSYRQMKYRLIWSVPKSRP